MKTLLYFLCDTMIGRTIGTLIPAYFFYIGLFKEFHFDNYKIDKMEIGLTIIFGLIIFGILFVYSKIRYFKVRQKYFDIMLIKFQDQFKGHRCSVFDDDLKIFSKEEFKLLLSYLKELEDLRIFMRGTNKTQGMFMP